MSTNKGTTLVASDPVPAQIDVVIPVYNETEAVASLAQRFASIFEQEKISYRLIFVDDRSTDTTLKTLHKLQKKYPIVVINKQGKRGKAYSILEAEQVVTAPYVAMIDADLQYPPETLPTMLQLTQQFGVVVARRNRSAEKWSRRVSSRGFQWVFGKILHGLDCDVQSGLKVFKREILKYVKPDDVTPWTIDIPLLITALDLGFQIGEVEIAFEKRQFGESKIKLISSIKEIGGQAIKYKLKRKNPFQISPTDTRTMLGAGMTYHRQRFVTHSTLQPTSSALRVVERSQKMAILSVAVLSLLFFITNPLGALQIFVALLSFIYFVDVFFNLFLVSKSLHHDPEIKISDKLIKALKDKDLPLYTILCPLYKEAHVLPQFIAAIEKLDWPKKKLDVQLLLESDDAETIAAAMAMKLPSYVQVQIVPHSQPKTKPKACNYGLNCAQGEYLVVFDAEDIPDPQQLKKVYIAFQQSAPEVKCIQAKLNFYNPHQNLLTRFFTAEYSLWFDLSLTGLQSVETTIPLGGTSNHFRTRDLITLEGWDPFNVTEDCDLGVRLFKQGGRTAIINSTTLEEANSQWGNWIRQRSRWIKGYMQTYLVHMRHPIQFFRRHGRHALMFQLTVGGKIAFMLINPIMWFLTISYFALYAWVGPTIETLYPSSIFYMAVVSLIFGNFLFLYYYMIGAAKREQWSIIKWVFLVPFYWLLVSVAAAIALYQLILKPHYWEKTVHGLHLKKEQLSESVTEVTRQLVAETAVGSQAIFIAAAKGGGGSHADIFDLDGIKNRRSVRSLLSVLSVTKALPVAKTIQILRTPMYQGGVLYLVATLVANVVNMATNFYLGKQLSFADFGLFNIMLSFFYLTSIPVNALGNTINYKTSYLLGKHGLRSATQFIVSTHRKALIWAIPLSLVWIVIAPWLTKSFELPSQIPLMIFTIIWLINLSYTINSSYITARLLFQQVAVLVIAQPVSRLLSAAVLANFYPSYVFVSLLIGLLVVAGIAFFLARRGNDTFSDKREYHIPVSFFLAALVTGLSTIAFFSLDNLLIAHLMNPEQVGQYAFMGLFGKMVFFIGSMATTFIVPLVARREGAGQATWNVFRYTLVTVVAMTSVGYLVFILGTHLFGHILMGSKIGVIHDQLIWYGLGVSFFTISQIIVSYHLVKKQYVFPITAFLLCAVQIGALLRFHGSLDQVTMVMFFIGTLHLVVLGVLHANYARIKVPLTNFNDLFGLFQPWQQVVRQTGQISGKRILLFNWRDTKHVWSGGAEAYIHQVATRLVDRGNSVTLFCGNDGKSPRYEEVNGVSVVRRGGFYMVYFWAFLYYWTAFRNHIDCIIDAENGIPFLTPLYSQKPIVLLIFHVHQEVFRNHLSFPLREIALFIEGILMPQLYKKHSVATISASSKREIGKLGFSDTESIAVIHPGVNVSPSRVKRKTTYPSLCYVGRLMPYKKVDVIIRAFFAVHANHPTAHLTIAGSGEMKSDLQQLVAKYKLQAHVTFAGRVSETEKADIFASHWIALQPSMVEGWGITVIEANCFGTPVIASQVNGLKDAVQDMKTGLLVPANDIVGFSLAMEKLISDTQLRQKMSRAAKKWSTKFSWDEAAVEYERILHSLRNDVSSVASVEPLSSDLVAEK